ncbi:Mitochondrial thiamine pyrophosphate carrier 1 [Taphrina deformans PYCC 5710]|uniref:Mitochondrial thiamine pyrophosphate carrier 1 n=1 Tax=Taphrina deformans (strain PYCC 5710 / ATCC 11124 / CBS 356.35 / IMI 108563 / JCM 9778 / NBRC 8474) TaxID=1097556 RepID=R4XPJ4_TAPDE|nr:Mitochondrial thiamine pyrophosphate carrier 1 [Taphrina deformans PYCC 5710]|eukprot:CCG85136.1 Mitochondrial thiamine pyrophosphate carrier 1 [Taphrina deformans PYCC 5710]
MKEKDKAWETVVCGGTAGLVARFFIAPLDVLKIRLQLQSSSSGQLYRGTVHGFRTIVQEEGVRALWKGNVPAELLYVTYSATQFLTYKTTNDASRALCPSSWPEATHAFIAGAGAGAVATTVTYPFDLLRTRFAAQRNSGPYKSLRKAVAEVVRTEGLRGMYRGLYASITQIVPYMGLLFGTYEPLRKGMSGLGMPNGWDNAVAGFLAGTFSKTGVFPLDVIRKRLQVQGPTRTAYVFNDIPVYSSSLSCATTILQREGVRGFYKGLTVSLLKSAPSSAITLWTFEQSSRLLHYVERKLGTDDVVSR